VVIPSEARAFEELSSRAKRGTYSRLKRSLASMTKWAALLAFCPVMLLSAAGASLPRHATDAPVADAAMKRDSARVRLLLKQGADVNAAQGDGMTALHWAAMNGDADEARMLIYAGARVDAMTRNGSYTPLHLAARAGNASVSKALLDGGAN